MGTVERLLLASAVAPGRREPPEPRRPGIAWPAISRSWPSASTPGSIRRAASLRRRRSSRRRMGSSSWHAAWRAGGLRRPQVPGGPWRDQAHVGQPHPPAASASGSASWIVSRTSRGNSASRSFDSRRTRPLPRPKRSTGPADIAKCAPSTTSPTRITGSRRHWRHPAVGAVRPVPERPFLTARVALARNAPVRGRARCPPALRAAGHRARRVGGSDAGEPRRLSLS